MSQKNPVAAAWFRAISRAVLVCYWLAMFLGTHWPHVHLSGYPQHADKYLHYFAYGGLSFLIAVCVSAKRDVGLREASWIFAASFVYSIVDEVSQIPVGRSCDFFDALADWVGALCGLTLFAMVRRTVRRLAAN